MTIIIFAVCIFSQVYYAQAKDINLSLPSGLKSSLTGFLQAARFDREVN